MIERIDFPDIAINDLHFYQIALNLSGRREMLEKRAADLINDFGYIESLKKSKQKKWQKIF